MVEHSEHRDVIVVGGGAAGLSAALTLARARRAVTVIDAGAPRNAPAERVHGLLGFDGTPPGELLARGRDEVTRYGGEILAGEVGSATRVDDGFAIRLLDGTILRARQLLIATGVTDELPEIPGMAERWGRDVVHCPYCHGWEIRDRIIGAIVTGPMSVSLHQTLLFSQWSSDVRLFTDGRQIEAPDRTKLDAVGIRVVEEPIAGLEITDDRLRGVRLGDETVVGVEAVVVATRMIARTGPFTELGIETSEHPLGSSIRTDEAGQTSVRGVWAAGNAADLVAQVSAAAADGARTAAQINVDLVMQDADRAVAAWESALIAR